MSEVFEKDLSLESPEQISMRYYETRHQLIETNLDTLSVSLTASVVSVKKYPECVDSQPVSASTTPLTCTPPLADLPYIEKPSDNTVLISESQVQQIPTVPVTEKPPKMSEEFLPTQLDNNVNPPASEGTGKFARLEDTCFQIIVFFSECCMCYGHEG